MSKNEFYRLYDLVCGTNKFLGETKYELIDILTAYGWNEIECVADILSEPLSVKGYQPDQIISLLENAKRESRKIELKKSNNVPFEQFTKIRDVENRFITENFKLIILMKLISLNISK